MIQVQNLQFSYTKSPFIENMNFQVQKGEIFGFLGPSGAGKSTLQKILIGMIQNYRGNATVNNVQCKKADRSFYQNIGVDFEFPSLYNKLTAAENLNFFASLYQNTPYPVDELLNEVGLLSAKDKKVDTFSKGMKSRLNFVKSYIHNPSILFLDEPTSGLDPTNAQIMKDIILKHKQKGKTIILTTHNMNDATQLCDKVAFIVDGKLKILDTPHNLIMQRGAAKVRYVYLENNIEQTSETPLQQIGQDTLFLRLVKENRLLSVHSSEPTLNDIFIEVTGRTLVWI